MLFFYLFVMIAAALVLGRSLQLLYLESFMPWLSEKKAAADKAAAEKAAAEKAAADKAAAEKAAADKAAAEKAAAEKAAAEKAKAKKAKAKKAKAKKSEAESVSVSVVIDTDLGQLEPAPEPETEPAPEPETEPAPEPETEPAPEPETEPAPEPETDPEHQAWLGLAPEPEPAPKSYFQLMQERQAPSRTNTGDWPNESWTYQQLVEWCGGEAEVNPELDTPAKLFQDILANYLDSVHPADQILGVPAWRLWDEDDRAWEVVVAKASNQANKHPTLTASLEELKEAVKARKFGKAEEILRIFERSLNWAITMDLGTEEDDNFI